MLGGVDPDIRGGSTVIRVVGSWGIIPATADLITSCHMGLFLLHSDAFLAGAFPEDIDQAQWMHRSVLTGYTGDLAANTQQFTREPIDIRAKRKLGAEDLLVFLAENISAVVSSVRFLFNLRVLLQKA